MQSGPPSFPGSPGVDFAILKVTTGPQG
jgi:hypothetical protein